MLERPGDRGYPEPTMPAMPALHAVSAARLTRLAGVAALLFLVSCSSEDSGSPLPRAPGSADEQVTQKAVEKIVAADAARRAAEAAERETAALAKAALRRALDTGGLALARLDALGAEFERWAKEVEPLLTSEQGRVLAGEDRLVESFLEVYRTERPSRDEAASVRTHVETLLELPRQADKNGDPYAPSATLQAELEKDKQWAENAVRVYQGGRERILALVAGAQKSNPTPTGPTLQAAIDELTARKALLAADADKARRERLAAEDAAAKAAIEEKNAVAERERLARDAELKRKTDDLAAEQARLKKLADDPNIRAKFAPILAKGLYVPCLSPRRTYDYPVPMSYSQMQECGGTTDVKMFVQLGLGGWNDRPAWKPPRTEEDWRQYAELLALFNQLAPIWIADGVLLK